MGPNQWLPWRFYRSGWQGEFLPGVCAEAWHFLAPGGLFLFKGLGVKTKRVVRGGDDIRDIPTYHEGTSCLLISKYFLI